MNNTFQMIAAAFGLAAPVRTRDNVSRTSAPKMISTDERERRKRKKRIAAQSRKRNR